MNYRYRPFAAAAALTLAATPAAAQDFTLHTVTTYKMSGVLGFAAKLGGAPKETMETTYLSGHKLRTDTQDASTIIDADAGMITMINKKDKSYTTMSFEQMAEMMRQMQAQAAKSAQQQPKQTEKAEKTDVEMKYSAKVDVTGEQQKIAGHNAKRALLTVAMDAAARPEDQKEMQQAGSLVILVDMWNAEDVPHARAMKAFEEAYARKAAREFGAEARGMASLSAAYPGIKEAMEAAGKEMKKVTGISVRTVTHIVLVPPDKKFDRELALAGGKPEGEKASEKKPGGLGGALSGMLGQKKKSDAAPDGGEQQAETKQSTIMAVTNELRDVQAGGVPADAFVIPAGYKERKFRE